MSKHKMILAMVMPNEIHGLFDVAATRNDEFKFFQVRGNNADEVREKCANDGWFVHEVIPAIEEV